MPSPWRLWNAILGCVRSSKSLPLLLLNCNEVSIHYTDNDIDWLSGHTINRPITAIWFFLCNLVPGHFSTRFDQILLTCISKGNFLKDISLVTNTELSSAKVNYFCSSKFSIIMRTQFKLTNKFHNIRGFQSSLHVTSSGCVCVWLKDFPFDLHREFSTGNSVPMGAEAWFR